LDASEPQMVLRSAGLGWVLYKRKQVAPLLEQMSNSILNGSQKTGRWSSNSQLDRDGEEGEEESRLGGKHFWKIWREEEK